MLRQVGIQTLNQKPLLPFVFPDRGDSHGDRWPVPGGKGKVESNQSQLAILDKGKVLPRANMGRPSLQSLIGISNRSLHKTKNVLDPGAHSRVDTNFVTTAPNPRCPLRSGDLSHATGVSTDTLRHYERLGILKKPPRTQGGYRFYPPESMDRELLVRNALASGFTLKELVEVLRIRDAGGAPCRRVAQLGHEKVCQLDLQIAHLTQLRDSLKVMVLDWDLRLEGGPPNDRAHLLELLSRKEKQQNIDPTGEENEDTRDRRVNGVPGLSLRPKRNF